MSQKNDRMLTKALNLFTKLLAVWVVAAVPNVFFAAWCIITASLLAGIWAKKGDTTAGSATS